MPRAFSALLLLGLAGCQAFEPPPNNPPLALHYPPGVNGDMPHLNPGNRVDVSVMVTTRGGSPVAGVEIFWDDGFYPPLSTPARSVSDAAGRATTTWVLPPLPPGAFSQSRRIRAFLPGAVNSPVEYRALVMACTRCGGN